MTKEPEKSSLMGYEELMESVKESLTPIDFDGLIASGVLEQKGAWYKINKWNELPEHARKKISNIKSKSGSPPLVKFRKLSKKLEKFFKNELKNK